MRGWQADGSLSGSQMFAAGDRIRPSAATQLRPTHLTHPASTPAGDPLLAATPSLAQALSAVRGGDVGTAVPPKLAAALAPRLAGYPERATEQMHVAHALLPARVAYLLAAEPQLVAAAVEAFHYRDPDDMKVRWF